MKTKGEIGKRPVMERNSKVTHQRKRNVQCPNARQRGRRGKSRGSLRGGDQMEGESQGTGHLLKGEKEKSPPSVGFTLGEEAPASIDAREKKG